MYEADLQFVVIILKNLVELAQDPPLTEEKMVAY